VIFPLREGAKDLQTTQTRGTAAIITPRVRRFFRRGLYTLFGHPDEGRLPDRVIATEKAGEEDL
jgi:hypothetical protein